MQSEFKATDGELETVLAAPGWRSDDKFDMTIANWEFGQKSPSRVRHLNAFLFIIASHFSKGI